METIVVQDSAAQSDSGVSSGKNFVNSLFHILNVSGLFQARVSLSIYVWIREYILKFVYIRMDQGIYFEPLTAQWQQIWAWLYSRGFTLEGWEAFAADILSPILKTCEKLQWLPFQYHRFIVRVIVVCNYAAWVALLYCVISLFIQRLFAANGNVQWKVFLRTANTVIRKLNQVNNGYISEVAYC